MSQPLDPVRAHVRGHFAEAGIDDEPDSASVTFLGLERVEVLRFGPDPQGVAHYVTLGCSRHPMTEPTSGVADPLLGPRAEVVLTLRATTPTTGLARSLAVVAATPAVEGVVLVADALSRTTPGSGIMRGDTLAPHPAEIALECGCPERSADRVAGRS